MICDLSRTLPLHSRAFQSRRLLPQPEVSQDEDDDHDDSDDVEDVVHLVSSFLPSTLVAITPAGLVDQGPPVQSE
jgi:hypothetical protein